MDKSKSVLNQLKKIKIMRKITFEVPSEVIGDFTEKMTDLELENSIVGKTDDDEILVEVLYDKSEITEVDELEEYLSSLIDGMEDEDDEEEEEDENDR
jgi:hypothetical protein